MRERRTKLINFSTSFIVWRKTKEDNGRGFWRRWIEHPPMTARWLDDDGTIPRCIPCRFPDWRIPLQLIEPLRIWDAKFEEAEASISCMLICIVGWWRHAHEIHLFQFPFFSRLSLAPIFLFLLSSVSSEIFRELFRWLLLLVCCSVDE